MGRCAISEAAGKAYGEAESRWLCVGAFARQRLPDDADLVDQPASSTCQYVVSFPTLACASRAANHRQIRCSTSVNLDILPIFLLVPQLLQLQHNEEVRRLTMAATSRSRVKQWRESRPFCATARCSVCVY